MPSDYKSSTEFRIIKQLKEDALDAAIDGPPRPPSLSCTEASMHVLWGVFLPRTHTTSQRSLKCQTSPFLCTGPVCLCALHTAFAPMVRSVLGGSVVRSWSVVRSARAHCADTHPVRYTTPSREPRPPSGCGVCWGRVCQCYISLHQTLHPATCGTVASRSTDFEPFFSMPRFTFHSPPPPCQVLPPNCSKAFCLVSPPSRLTPDANSCPPS